MTSLLTFLLAAAAFLVFIPAAVLFAEVLLGVTGTSDVDVLEGDRPRLAIVIPAHNEQSVIADTLSTIVPQLRSDDRLVVVADNCSDDTAAIAKTEGAEVTVRNDLERRGKGYALDFGVRHLEEDPTSVVLIIDADCKVAAGAIDRLARLCDRSGRPVQALYLMHGTKSAGLKTRIAEFAWAVKNQIRPLGLHRLGLPCQLMGTGMAFPWTCISSAVLATGHIVEDLKLGIDLARTGTPPLFCPTALVTSEFPATDEGVSSQRTRWEHGHLSVILNEAALLFFGALARRDMNSMALALDLIVPPFAFLVLAVTAVWFASALLYIFAKSLIPLGVATIAVISLPLSVLLAWARCGRRIVSLADLVLAPVYVLWKIPLYVKFFVSRQMEWVRSGRDPKKGNVRD